MRRKAVVFGLVAASLCVPAIAGAADRETDRGRLIHVVKDPATKADVRIYEAGPNDLTLEVAQGALSVSKRLTNGRAITTVRDGRNEVRLSFDRAQFVIDDGRGPLVIAAGSTDGARQIQARIGQSSLVRRGADLIGRVNAQTNSPLAHQLRSTRALLLLMVGDTSGRDELAAYMRRLSAAKVRPVSLQSPTDCWNQYAQEAIGAWMEYEQCYAAIPWWDVLGMLACDVIYDMRAIGAFSWWVHCVALS